MNCQSNELSNTFIDPIRILKKDWAFRIPHEQKRKGRPHYPTSQ